MEGKACNFTLPGHVGGERKVLTGKVCLEWHDQSEIQREAQTERGSYLSRGMVHPEHIKMYDPDATTPKFILSQEG